MAVEVRKATSEDIDWLIMQLRAFETFAGYRRSLLEDENEARVKLAEYIAHHVVLIAHDGSDRFGFIAGVIAPHPFNSRLRVLAEIFWWVMPEHRGTRAGAMLLREFEHLGRQIADWVLFSLEHNSPVREKHLTERGFRQVERAFLLEI